MKPVESTENFPFRSTLAGRCSNFQCRVTVIVMSVILILMGTSLFLCGCLMIWSTTAVELHFKGSLNNFLTFSGLIHNVQAKRVLVNALLEYTAPMGIILFWAGISVISVTGVGLYGAITRNRFILFMFASMMLAKIFVVSIIVMTFHAYPTVVVDIYKNMAWKAVKGYRSMMSSDADSMIVSLIMPMFQCCGMSNGEDFAGSVNFERKLESGTHIMSINYPLPCCKLKNTYEPVYRNCPKIMDERNSNIKTGCWPILEQTIQTVYTKVSYIVICMTVLELALACVSIYLTLLM